VEITPQPIPSGGILTAVSPAGPVSREEVESGIAALRELGYTVHASAHALDSGEYLAGFDSIRADDLMAAFRDDDSDGIICTRGGYGTMRLLPLLDWKLFPNHPKSFTGFSDVSALQLTLWKRSGLVTFSGPQLARGFSRNLDAFSTQQWLRMVQGNAWGVPLLMPEGESLTPVVGGKESGPLLGGNLAVLAALCGTEWAPGFLGAIVVLEEIDEPPYRIDRMLTQLLMTGAFDGVKAILLGRFDQHVKGEKYDRTSTVVSVLREALPSVPLVCGAPYGHTGPTWTLPVGAWATLDIDAGTLITEPAR
jgi:muramoyltetrapeptide carboxypeptidase